MFSKRSAALFKKCLSTKCITDYNPYLSEISSRRQPSAIRKLMPLMAQEGMVSLGGGLPNPTLFPFQSLQFSVTSPDGSASEMLTLSSEELKLALQYSPTPGLPKFIDQLKDLQKREHGDGEYDVTVTVGSQDGMCKAFEMLLDPGHDELFVENPTYSGALSFLRPFGVKLTPVATDEYGLHPDSLLEALEASKHVGHLNKKRVLYTIPTAQNPSGSTLSNDRRQRVYEIAQEHDMIILEDDPYYFLHPNRQDLKSFLSMDTDGRVLRFDSMSKLISSGMRIGFATGPPKLMERLNFHIQATNLHNSGTYANWIIVMVWIIVHAPN
jgi:kynurenine/2-aminoadipate aminotransferase